MNPVFTTNVRDKIALLALILFGVLSFITLWIYKDLAQAMIGLIGMIVAVLAAFFKGNPAPPDTTKTTEVTTSSTTQPLPDNAPGAPALTPPRALDSAAPPPGATIPPDITKLEQDFKEAQTTTLPPTTGGQ